MDKHLKKGLWLMLGLGVGIGLTLAGILYETLPLQQPLPSDQVVLDRARELGWIDPTTWTPHQPVREIVTVTEWDGLLLIAGESTWEEAGQLLKDAGLLVGEPEALLELAQERGFAENGIKHGIYRLENQSVTVEQALLLLAGEPAR